MSTFPTRNSSKVAPEHGLQSRPMRRSRARELSEPVRIARNERQSRQQVEAEELGMPTLITSRIVSENPQKNSILRFRNA